MGGSYFDMRSFDETVTESSQKKDIRKKNVFIIDDSILVVNQLIQILENNKFTIAGSASSGTEAVELYGDLLAQVDLIILDDSIRGEMDSLTILKKVLAGKGEATVFMICRMGREEHGAQAISLGAGGCIIKPLEEVAVIKKIQSVIG